MRLIVRHTLLRPGELYTSVADIAEYLEQFCEWGSFEPLPADADFETVSAWIKRNKRIVTHPVGWFQQGGPYIELGTISERED